MTKFWQETRDELINLLAPFIARGVETAVQNGTRFIPEAGKPRVDWKQINEAAKAYARDHTYDLVQGLTDTTRNDLIDKVYFWLKSGKPLSALEKELRDGLFSNERARTIAATEVTRVFAEGNMIAWRGSDGMVQGRQWKTAVDKRVCPICGTLHNQVAPLDSGFSGGINNPPGHVKCRCWIVPKVETNLKPLPKPKAAPAQVSQPVAAPPPPRERKARTPGQAKVKQAPPPTQQKPKLPTPAEIRQKILTSGGVDQAKVSLLEREMARVQAARVTEKNPDKKFALEDRYYELLHDLEKARKGKVSAPGSVSDPKAFGLPGSNFRVPTRGLVADRKGMTDWDAGIGWLRGVVGPNVRLTSDLFAVHIPKTSRAGYMKAGNSLSFSDARVLVHEFGHYIEHSDPRIHEKTKAFLLRRTKGEKPQSMREATGSAFYKTDEITLKDKFYNPYVGRLYYEDGAAQIREGSTEIFSMGLEALYKDPVKFAREDPEHFDLTIEILQMTY